MRRRLLLLLTPLALLAGVGAVTLAAPGIDACVAQASSDPDLEGRISCPGAAPATPGLITAAGAGAGVAATSAPGAQPVCALSTRLRSVGATRRAAGVRFAFVRRGTGPVTVDLFRVSDGRRVLGNRRVARFTRRASSFTWSGRGVGDGEYIARYRSTGAGTRRLALRRADGRFSPRPDFEADDGCGPLRSFKLERPAFGGRSNRSLGISYRLDRAGRVTVTVTRAGRTVRRFRASTDRAGRTYRLRLAAEGLRRGDHQVRISIRPTGGAPVTARLTSARL